MPKKNKRKSVFDRRSKFGKGWYTGRDYQEGVYYNTFLSARINPGSTSLLSFKNYARVVANMKKLVPNPRNCIALEIGPGEAPVIPLLPFKKMVFMDRSKAVALGLRNTVLPGKAVVERLIQDPLYEFLDFKGSASSPIRSFKGLTGKKASIVVGDVRALPFKPSAKFDLVVLNEVLTHVRPQERTKVIEQIAKKANSILILDRPQISLKELRKIREKPYYYHELSMAELRSFQATLVFFPRIIKILEHNGFEVQTKTYGDGMDSYTILRAKKK